MKKYGIFVVLVAVAVGMVSCNQGGEEVTTASGMKYTVLKAGTDRIQPKDMMMVSFVATDANDSIWMDSRPDGIPRPARKLDSISLLTQGGIEEVLFYLKKGDSVSFQVPVEKVYGNRQPLPTGVAPGSLLTIGLKVEDAMNQEAFNEYRKEMMAKQQEIAAGKSVEQLAIDGELIDAYLAENNIEAQKTESGLRYVISQEGEGDNVQSGQKVTVNYSGHTMNGAFFDSSIEEVARENGKFQEGRPYGPYPTVIGQGAVIKGWDEAFQLMNAGTKATLYIPSGLAYGPRARSEEIPANAILIFDVELVEIINE
jgi:FKBP-type peptidyl-prolyl cis-trans isomerase